MRPKNCVYESDSNRKIFLIKLERLINAGFNNIEIPWEDHHNWIELMSCIRSKFPNLNLGSATVLNKKSINDALKLNLNFSMMRFWEKDLINYSNLNNYLLIPGINTLNDLKEAISLNCKVIKIYPISEKDKSIQINKFNDKVTFIAAGGLSISDIEEYYSMGFKAIVIGAKGFDGNIFDPELFKWINNIDIK